MVSFRDIFDDRLLPWVNERGARRLVAMGRRTPAAELPPDVRVTRKIPRGPRQAVKGTRHLRDPDGVTARWPRDGLLETAGVPILIAVLAGRVDYWAGDSVVHCGAGHFLVLPPGIRHDGGFKPHYEFDAQAPGADDFCDLIWFGRWGRIIRCWTCHSKGADHGSQLSAVVNFMNEAANQVIDLLVDEAVAGHPGWDAICHDYLAILLTVLRREFDLGANLTSATLRSNDPIRQLPADPIERVQKFTRTRLRRHMPIDEMARYVHMSRSQFTRRFREQTGMTFNEYLTACRIEEAQTLLRDSNWSVRRISNAVGLASAPYFCELFTRRVGMSPQTYRDRHAGNG